jgi:hypothetical protein
MPAFIDNTGATQQVDFTPEELIQGAKASGLTPVQYINRKFPQADLKIGSAFDQIKMSIGIVSPADKNPFGLRPTPMATLMDNGYSAVSNTATATSPFGSASRALTVISIIDSIESQVAKDRTTDADTFYGMVGTTLSLTSEHFEQPVVDYGTVGGPESAKASRVSQGALPPKMVTFKTADRIRRIGSWSIGMEWTDQALRATTLDFVSLTTARYLQVERDERAYRYISDLFTGNGDLITGAVSAVTTTSLDALATGGVLTHKAWVKFLARNRKYRKITHAIMDMDTYLKLEGRTGRPGSNNYDPTLARIDPQGVMVNNGFGNDVRVFLVEAATDGGPVPANTIYAVDAAKSAITLAQNTSAIYSAVEEYALKRTTAMRMDWSEEVFRTYGDTDLRLFDVLTIA